MKRKRFSVEQMVAVVKQAELGLPVAELIRQVGISEQTFYRWKKEYAGLEPAQARELKQLGEENARLKKLVAELSLDKAVLQDVLAKKFPASAHERRCSLRDGVSWLQRSPGLCADTPGAFDPTQTEPAQSAYSHPSPDARNRSGTGAIWLSTLPRLAQTRGLERGSQSGLPAVPRGRSGAAPPATAPPQGGGKSRGAL